MESFLTSTITVSLAEIGDKSQLLALVLATRFQNKWAILFGASIAILLNHGVSAWFGTWLTQFFQSDTARALVGTSFIVLAIWLLIPEKNKEVASKFDGYSAFWMSAILFFFAEIGDKTQIATVLLAAQFDSIILVTLGTTTGILITIIPVVFASKYITGRISIRLSRIISAGVFAVIGLIQLFG